MNLTIKDSPEESAAAAGSVLGLCQMVNTLVALEPRLCFHECTSPVKEVPMPSKLAIGTKAIAIDSRQKSL